MSAGPGRFVASHNAIQVEDISGEFAMNALRLNDGFTLAQFSARTGLASTVLASPLSTLSRRGLLVQDNERITTTGLGRRFLDSVVAEFFPD